MKQANDVPTDSYVPQSNEDVIQQVDQHDNSSHENEERSTAIDGIIVASEVDSGSIGTHINSNNIVINAPEPSSAQHPGFVAVPWNTDATTTTNAQMTANNSIASPGDVISQKTVPVPVPVPVQLHQPQRGKKELSKELQYIESEEIVLASTTTSNRTSLPPQDASMARSNMISTQQAPDSSNHEGYDINNLQNQTRIALSHPLQSAVPVQPSSDMDQRIRALERQLEIQNQLLQQARQANERPVVTAQPILSCSEEDNRSMQDGGDPDQSEDAKNTTPTWPYRKCYIIFACLTVAAVGFGVGMAASNLGRASSTSTSESRSDNMGGGPPTQTPIIDEAPTNMLTMAPIETVQPTARPTARPTQVFDMFLDILEPFLRGSPTFTDRTVLANPSTPQYAALNWLANEDGFDHFGGMDDGAIAVDGDPIYLQALLERYAMAVLYYSLGGPSWQNQHGFLSDSSICDWANAEHFVLACHSDTNLLGAFMQLSDNGLEGSLPDELYLFTHLQRFIIEDVPFQGSISSHIAQLSNLRILYIDNTELEGSIPTEIGTLEYLEVAMVLNSQLTGTLPTELGNLERMREFQIGNVNIGGSIPTEIGRLTSLTIFATSSASLVRTIPSEIGHLTDLIILWLAFNDLSGSMPTEIGNMTRLTDLNLTLNKLNGRIPSHIGRLTRLNDLSLAQNDFSGALPAELANMNPTWLLLASNNLSGTIPIGIASMSALAYFTVAWNSMTGSIPSELGSLESLIGLYLHNNHFNRTIPTELGLIFTLQELSLAENDLVGTMPSEIGQLPWLTRVYLQRNELSGTLPIELSRLAWLEDWNMEWNNIVGNVDPIFCHNNKPTGRLSSDCLDIQASEGGTIEVAETVCSCCTICCSRNEDAEVGTCEFQDAEAVEDCVNGNCISCGFDRFAPSCEECSIVPGNASGADSASFCAGGCSWNATLSVCEARTEF